MTSAPILFSHYLSQRLRNYRVLIPLAVSLVSGVSIASAALYMLIRTDSAVLGSAAPHIAVLIETNDRPELQRFISTIGHSGGSQVEVVLSGEVIASTKSRSEIGTKKAESRKSDLLSCLNRGMHVGRAEVIRPDGPSLDAEVRLYTPLLPLAGAVGGVTLLTFLFTWATGWFLASRIGAVARESLEPVERLDCAIRSLAQRNLRAEIAPFGIIELENIRTAVLNTQSELERMTEELTEAKAKELSELAYKRLIHDLHTPVTALRQCIKASTNDRLSDEKKAEARAHVVELAEQILSQVGAGKDNLGLAIRLKKNADLRTSVLNAVTHARLASHEKSYVDICENVPNEPVLVDHDPLMIGRVVSNLVSNAVEAKSQRVNVVVEMFDGRPRIKVSDDGPGMMPETVALHLTGRGRSTKADRSGYGLSSCNHIVRSHGGRIVYRNLSVGGSEFEIRM